MNDGLNNNNQLVAFLNNLFRNEKITNVAPNIIKFFIITRNYGLIDYENNINKLQSNYNFEDLCLAVIKQGFQKDHIEFNNDNLTGFLITNYHANGFYFHSFPGIYENSIEENGILANNRNEDDSRYFEIVDKYHFGEYFKKVDNRICVSEKISNFGTSEYAIFTPEWLEMFLKQGNRDIHDAFKKGNINEMQNIADNALNCFHIGMQRNPSYNEIDFAFLSNYIKKIVNKRFSNENNRVSIALIFKDKTDEYFGKHIKTEDIPKFSEYIQMRNMNDKEIFSFIIEILSNGEKTTNKNIPNDMFEIISYNINKENEIENKNRK